MEKGLMKLESLAQYLDISLAQLYLLKKRSDFPKPVVFGNADAMQTKKFYRRATIDKWLASLDPNEKELSNDCGND